MMSALQAEHNTAQNAERMAKSPMTFPTLRKATEFLDTYLGLEGHYFNGSHYMRPDGTRGPIIYYLWGTNGLLFGASRNAARTWEVTDAFWEDRIPAIMTILDDLWGKLGAEPLWLDDESCLYRLDDFPLD